MFGQFNLLHNGPLQRKNLKSGHLEKPSRACSSARSRGLTPALRSVSNETYQVDRRACASFALRRGLTPAARKRAREFKRLTRQGFRHGWRKGARTGRAAIGQRAAASLMRSRRKPAFSGFLEVPISDHGLPAAWPTARHKRPDVPAMSGDFPVRQSARAP